MLEQPVRINSDSGINASCMMFGKKKLHLFGRDGHKFSVLILHYKRSAVLLTYILFINNYWNVTCATILHLIRVKQLTIVNSIPWKGKW